MRRDYDLIRRILLTLEDIPAGGDFSRLARLQVSALGEEPVIVEHLRLMNEERLITVKITFFPSGNSDVAILSMDSRGHDFVEKFRTGERLKSALRWLAKHGLSVTVSALLQWTASQ